MPVHTERQLPDRPTGHPAHFLLASLLASTGGVALRSAATRDLTGRFPAVRCIPVPAERPAGCVPVVSHGSSIVLAELQSFIARILLPWIVALYDLLLGWYGGV